MGQSYIPDAQKDYGREMLLDLFQHYGSDRTLAVKLRTNQTHVRKILRRESDLGQLEALCLVSALRLAVAVAAVDSQPVAAALDQAQALRNLLRARHRA